MPSHAEERFVPYAPEDMFSIVADVTRYPEFLPWCAGARIRARERVDGHESLVADLVVAYKVFCERFTSRVTLDPEHNRISVEYLDGPFKHLVNRWTFHPHTDEKGRKGTCIDFFVDLEFKSRTLQKLIERKFADAAEKMAASFEDRAHDLFGEKDARAPEAASAS